jgi:hypothetical protein
MRPVAPAVPDNLLIVAPGVHQGVGQQPESVKGPVLVDAAGQADGVGRLPPRADGDGAERVAEDVAEKFQVRVGPIRTLTLNRRSSVRTWIVED